VIKALALLLAAVAAPAQAQRAPTLTMEPEAEVTVVLDREGAPGVVVTQRRRAAWTPFDLAVARNFVTGAYDAGVGNNSVSTGDAPGIPDPPQILPDGVRIRFMHVAGLHSELILENGFELALTYRARITVDGVTRPTDVCVVAPNNRSTEHWPEGIERIELYDLYLIPWQVGRRITCE
jgi:hypothetical protein